MMSTAGELKVFVTSGEHDSRCCECGKRLKRGDWITLEQGRGALCLACADLDHLVFLPSGNAALTRRFRSYSTLSAAVLKCSRARKRYERQGLLVEEAGLARAEADCLADSEARERSRQREALRRQQIDRRHVEQFAARVRELYCGCPAERGASIAEHACRRSSGRIGRTAQGRNLDEQAVRAAVRVHVRHAESRYDELLALGCDRCEARAAVEGDVARVLSAWEQTPNAEHGPPRDEPPEVT